MDPNVKGPMFHTSSNFGGIKKTILRTSNGNANINSMNHHLIATFKLAQIKIHAMGSEHSGPNFCTSYNRKMEHNGIPKKWEWKMDLA